MSTKKQLYKNPEWLQKMYWEREFSTYDLAGFCGCSSVTILDWMGQLGIPTRSLAEGCRTIRRKEKLRRANVGRIHTKEARMKMSKSHKGKQMGSENPNWKGGRLVDAHGYVRIKRRDHPFADNNGYVYEHRLVMESYLGYILDTHLYVHHKDGNHSNNTLDNLEVMTPSEHNYHHKPNKRKAVLG